MTAAEADGGFDGVDDAGAAVAAQRPALDGGVGREHDDGDAADGGAAGEGAAVVCWGELFERAFVTERGQPCVG
jgi:hypothetical protein